ncbi:MAG: molybdopterin biosynthesis protein, partial [Desulfofustis sp.]|nr:molybdopterin biosynthesis protein [Desulfofustis sp.]
MKDQSVYVTNQPLDQAKASWLAAVDAAGFFQRRPQQTIRVDQALGRLTAEPVFARHSSPTYNAAAMDGIAVHFLDLSSASETNPVVLAADRFVKVNTGNAVPEGFNAVVMNEDIHWHVDGSAELVNPAPPWQHVRTVGEDIVATELIIPEGHIIRPIDLGAMLAAGVTDVTVRVPPKVVVIPTGSELIAPGHTVQPGQIIEFNSRILGGTLIEWGAEVEIHDPIADDRQLLREAISRVAASADIVVTNAGASAGSRDYSASTLSELGSIIV